MIQNKWKPDPAPQWVTAVPSQHHSQLVEDFAERLAARLALPFAPALRRHAGSRPQKEMQNSAGQLRNILKAFQVTTTSVAETGSTERASGLAELVQRLARQVTSMLGPATLPSLPVLLVDDVVDSRWTLTLASVLLQRHGSGLVYPFALAKASPRGS